MESVTLPDTVETIGVGVFENCPKLKKVQFGEALRTVKFRAFASCPQLGEIEFPKALKELAAETFLNCSSLSSVSFTGNVPLLVDNGEHLGDDIYKGTNPTLVTIVPKDANGWTDDSGKLPKVWPVAAGEFARAIRHASGKSKGRRK